MNKANRNEDFEDNNIILENHIRSNFKDNVITVEFWKDGPILEILPDFKVLKVKPGGELKLWAYFSIGSWYLFDNSKLEFIILALEDSEKYVERLAMTAYYHSLHRLGLNHTFPIGEPWNENSTLEYCLISRPFPLGLDVEICETKNGHLHFSWLLPITINEREYKIKNGIDALEEKFEEAELEYWDTRRKSVI